MPTLIETAEKFITDNAIVFKAGKREVFLNDLKRSIQPTRDGFRSTTGQKIDLESYMNAMLETALYGSRPSAKNYVPVFPIRSNDTKNTHRKLSETMIRKALAQENIILEPSVSEKVIETLAANFIPADDDSGLVFSRITDLSVGSVTSKDQYTLEQLLNATGASRFVDAQATKISKLAHRAALREKATGMFEHGTKPAAIEKLTDELLQFEARSLRSGMKIPPQIDRGRILDEFQKRAELEGLDRSSAQAVARNGVNSIEDLTQIKFAMQKIEVPSNISEYKF